MATVGSRMVDRVVGKLIEWCYVRGTDIVLVVVGVLFIGIGLGLWSTQRPIEGGIVTTGRIVDQVTRTDSDGEEMTFPVIEFTDKNERAHRFENKIGGGGVGGLQGTIGRWSRSATTRTSRHMPSGRISRAPGSRSWPSAWVPPSCSSSSGSSPAAPAAVEEQAREPPSLARRARRPVGP